MCNLLKSHIQIHKGNVNVKPGQEPTTQTIGRAISMKRKKETYDDEDMIEDRMKRKRICEVNTTSEFQTHIHRSSTPIPDEANFGGDLTLNFKDDQQRRKRKRANSGLSTAQLMMDNPVISPEY